MNTTRIIRVWMPDGFVAVKAAPTPVPGLYICEDPALPGIWSVTHLASGASVAKVEDPELALDLAVRLGPVTDWTLPAADLLRQMPQIRQQWERVLEEAGVPQPHGTAVPAEQLTAMEPLS